MLTIIVAHDQNRLIGGGNALLWHLPEDLKRFKALTTGHPILMGRKTFESIGRPLPNRSNIVISRNPQWKHEGVLSAESLEEAIGMASMQDSEIFLIGGGELYRQGLPHADILEITEVEGQYEGDTWFPEYQENFTEVGRESHPATVEQPLAHDFVRWVKKR
ncbi:MAG: dihydrofolate reductase [Schleiferiaceae bacterium]|nr:dihydrofolate reductase [Schleiferiaceae bacterium]